ncbi:MAG: hypothetical protein M3Z21_01205, partial [Pseudomonadota bacterium]|nr:hypothetical protein [Pseudomonadota bacterium]
LVSRLKAAGGGRFRLSLLRLQNSGREADDSHADGFVYAFCQALEHALGRKVPVRMQGITRAVSDADGPKADLARRNALQGLLAGLPLFLESAAVTAGPVGLVSFATRPSDVRFGVTAPGQTGYVFIGRSYMAVPQAGPPPGYLLHPGPHVLDGAFGEEAFRSPNGIYEVMADLRNKGCRHIILLGRHYGGRHIGRTATRHRHHDSPEFIADLFLRFPDVHIYPLWREVFYATRLHRRDRASEDAFDIDHWNDHMDEHMGLFIKKILGSPEIASNALPVYSLATLHVVARAGGDDALEKPQSGFCAYFLLHDAFDPRRPEASAAHRHNLEVFTGDDPQPRDALTAVLRAVHYMEAEKVYTATADKDQPRCAAPVLDAYPWSAPASRNGAGEIVWVRSRRRTVYLSLTGLLARIAPVVGMVAARRPVP